MTLHRGKHPAARATLEKETTTPPLAKAGLDKREPGVDKKKLERGVLVARTLFRASKEFTVDLMNVDDYPITC